MPTQQNNKSGQNWRKAYVSLLNLQGKITEKHAEEINDFINGAVAESILKDRVQTREKERKLVLTELIDDWRAWEDDMTVTVKEVLEHLKSLLPKSKDNDE